MCAPLKFGQELLSKIVDFKLSVNEMDRLDKWFPILTAHGVNNHHWLRRPCCRAVVSVCTLVLSSFMDCFFVAPRRLANIFLHLCAPLVVIFLLVVFLFVYNHWFRRFSWDFPLHLLTVSCVYGWRGAFWKPLSEGHCVTSRAFSDTILPLLAVAEVCITGHRNKFARSSPSFASVRVQVSLSSLQYHR